MQNEQFKRQNDDTRREMLAAIRGQLAASAPHDLVRKEHEAQRVHHAPANPTTIPFAESVADRFCASLVAVGGHCTLVAGVPEAANAVTQILEKIKARNVGLSGSPLVQSVMEQVRTNADVQIDRATPELFTCDAGVTGAQWAIAETGTLVLESDRERHRLTSLVPTAHIALIHAHQIRHTLGEVLQAISAGGADELSRTVTFITGPSRTSDIELTLAIGVHGPAELYVIVIREPVT
jgi:L-lactate dehydrogenase complex protein LldG